MYDAVAVDEFVVDEAVNAAGDVIGVIASGPFKIRYHIEGRCIAEAGEAGLDLLRELKAVLEHALLTDPERYRDEDDATVRCIAMKAGLLHG